MNKNIALMLVYFFSFKIFAMEIKPQIASTSPFPYKNPEPHETRFFSQGEAAILTPDSKYTHLLSYPFYPGFAVLCILGNKNIVALHYDYNTDLTSLDEIFTHYGVDRNNRSSITCTIYSEKVELDGWNRENTIRTSKEKWSYENLYGKKNQKSVIKYIGSILENKLLIPYKNIKYVLHDPSFNILEPQGIYMRKSLGIDKTGAIFHASLRDKNYLNNLVWEDLEGCEKDLIVSIEINQILFARHTKSHGIETNSVSELKKLKLRPFMNANDKPKADWPCYDETCAVCKNKAPLRCSRCKDIRYCSEECQKKDWVQHKKNCSS